jgi:hypothetical protein
MEEPLRVNHTWLIIIMWCLELATSPQHDLIAYSLVCISSHALIGAGCIVLAACLIMYTLNSYV